MKLALIGDLQYASDEAGAVSDELCRIASLRPDFALFMGDHAGQRLGARRGLAELKRHMDSLGCPYHAILGNHDVECFPHNYYTNLPIAEYRAIFGCDPWRAQVMDGVLFLFVTVERQPRETMRTIHAVYASDWQFDWIEDQLRLHPGMPTVIFSHAPAAGSALRCARPLHCASLDMYLDQTFDALRWRLLPRRFPQIKAWFSAHLHMGHDYASAIVERGGVTHVSCGVFVRCSRDGQHHTRFIETAGDKLTVSTFDHDRAGISLCEDAVIDLSGRVPTTAAAHIPEGEIFLGGDGVRSARYLAELDRYYISADSGCLWEYDPALDDLCGALTLERGCADLRFHKNRLYIKTQDGGIFSVDPTSRARFETIGGFAPQDKRDETQMRGEALADVAIETRESPEGVWLRLK